MLIILKIVIGRKKINLIDLLNVFVLYNFNVVMMLDSI